MGGRLRRRLRVCVNDRQDTLPLLQVVDVTLIGVLAVAAVGCSSPSIAFDAEDYSAVLRVVLPEDDSLWPQPTDRGPNFWWSDRAHHVGVLTESPYELPESYASHSTSA